MRKTSALRKALALPAVAVTVVLSGCGQQALIGERAIDPSAPQVTAEEAREEAKHLQESGGAGAAH